MNNFKTGDILVSSWGYEQTNVTYFEVIASKGQFVTVREIAKEQTQTEFMQGDATPVPGQYRSDPIRRMVKNTGGEDYIRISSYEYADRWDGKPQHYTAYA